MRTLKLVGTLTAVLALAALASATASAEVILWKWLPGKAGETFKGATGKATLQIKGSGSVTCKASEIKAKEGELLEEGTLEGKGAPLAEAIIHLLGCTAFGLTAHSEGDSSGIILFRVHLHNCLIGAEHTGVTIVINTPVHIEIVGTGLLIIWRGGVLILIVRLKGRVEELHINQKEGKQEYEKCEGGEKETSEASIDSGEFIQSGFEAKEASIEFEKEEQEAMT